MNNVTQALLEELQEEYDRFPVVFEAMQQVIFMKKITCYVSTMFNTICIEHALTSVSRRS